MAYLPALQKRLDPFGHVVSPGSDSFPRGVTLLPRDVQLLSAIGTAHAGVLRHTFWVLCAEFARLLNGAISF